MSIQDQTPSESSIRIENNIVIQNEQIVPKISELKIKQEPLSRNVL